MNCTYRCLTSKPLTTCRFVQRARRDTLEEEISNKRREPRSTQASPPLSTWKAKTLLQDACCEMGREDWLCEHVWRSRRTRAQAGKSLEGIRTLLRRKAWTLPRRHDWLMTGPSHVQLLQSPQARTKALCASQEMQSYSRRGSSPVKAMPRQRLPIGRGQRLAMYIIQKVVCIPRHRSAERQLPGTLACGPCQSHERTICASCRNAYAHALDPGP